ncbi:glutathione S-transferase T3-like [Oryza brachyantha]|uniref:No apical meristem-associated C-terminal domain-containing protein n=1 Tax=Oryza brachyantha TaxID=4533 RepID=J3M7B2_ORYBR|nr:glutathione S-transferase T3-like [Oryza brachyantha]XP_015693206.1 glutathione S-transferase T3-like [Oryza brachyantha]XP_040379803.1 glutathione S-transferase T3-like [Oryza brachyantha]XP_040379804.1 glutathione S-transferase T3-like [Oryza brachyantha]
MYYTQEEDLRLVSAWLNNSTDPIEGNARKGETYWSKVAEEYNETTPEGRKRDMSLLKGHWHKTTKKVSAFNGCYVQLRDAYASGRSDGQLMEQALELYRSREGTQFQYVHWWKAFADSPKWNVHVASGGPGPRKHTPDLNRAAEPMVRPMGIKRAKKGKGTTAEVAVEVKEHLKTLVDAQATQREETEGIKELQLQLSEQRVEAANLQLKAAKEKKEAKMIEKLSELLHVDTSNMMEWAREAHAKTVTHLMESIWGKGESGPPA